MDNKPPIGQIVNRMLKEEKAKCDVERRMILEMKREAHPEIYIIPPKLIRTFKTTYKPKAFRTNMRGKR